MPEYPYTPLTQTDTNSSQSPPLTDMPATCSHRQNPPPVCHRDAHLNGPCTTHLQCSQYAIPPHHQSRATASLPCHRIFHARRSPSDPTIGTRSNCGPCYTPTICIMFHRIRMQDSSPRCTGLLVLQFFLFLCRLSFDSLLVSSHCSSGTPSA